MPQIAIELSEDLLRKLDQLSEGKPYIRSALVKEAIKEFIHRELDLQELKKVIVERFAQGKISFDDLAELLGYREAKKLQIYKDMLFQGLEDAAQAARRLPHSSG